MASHDEVVARVRREQLLARAAHVRNQRLLDAWWRQQQRDDDDEQADEAGL
jgi:hypothetical protein